MSDTEIAVVEDTRLKELVKKSELDSTKAAILLENFKGYFAIAAEWEVKAHAIKVTKVTQKAEMKMARTGRLFLRGERLAIEKTRKSLKEQALREGKAIDGIANVLKALIVPLEEYLDAQEKYADILAAKELERIKAEQEAKAIAEAEAARIAQEKADREERERVAKENEKLRKEAAAAEAKRIAREREIDAERQKVEAKRIEVEKKVLAAQLKAKQEQERLQAENEAIARKAQADRERIEAEKVAAVKAAEHYAAQAKAEAEQAEAKRITAEAGATRLAQERASRDAAMVECPECGYHFFPGKINEALQK